MEDLKLKYNDLLKRAIKYTELPINTQEKYNNEFMKICSNMDNLIVEIGNCTKEEILNGFEV